MAVFCFCGASSGAGHSLTSSSRDTVTCQLSTSTPSSLNKQSELTIVATIHASIPAAFGVLGKDLANNQNERAFNQGGKAGKR